MDSFDKSKAVPTETFSFDRQPRIEFIGKDTDASRLLNDEFILATAFKLGKNWKQIDSDHNNTLSRSELGVFNTYLQSAEIHNGKMEQNHSSGLRFLCDNFDDIKGLHEGWTGSSDEIEREDLQYLTDLAYQRLLDERYFDRGKELLLANFEVIDANRDQKVQNTELLRFADISDLDKGDVAAVHYLAKRTAGDYSAEGLPLGDFNDGDYKVTFSGYKKVARFYDGQIGKSQAARATLEDQLKNTEKDVFGAPIMRGWDDKSKTLGYGLGFAGCAALSSASGPGLLIAGSVCAPLASSVVRTVGQYIGEQRALDYYNQRQMLTNKLFATH